MHDSGFQRCMTLVADLDREHEWGLTLHDQQDYAAHVAACCITIAGMSDARICNTIRHYHRDHALVEALRDANHHQHAACWAEWVRQATRILGACIAGRSSGDMAVVGFEDLAQEALHDLWRGLVQFKYQSSFQTWAYTIVSNALARHYRALQTKKRSALSVPLSLDPLLEHDAAFQHRRTPQPDEETLNTLLAEIVDQVLAQHPDRRLAVVFQLWAHDEQTLRMIGAQLQLSPARVHALLKQARALVRAELELQEWVEHAQCERSSSSACDTQLQH